MKLKYSLLELSAVLMITLVHFSYAAEQPAAPALAGIPIAPGQCWIYGQIKSKPVDQRVAVTVKDAQTAVDITPAEIRRGFKRVITREGTVTYKIKPPSYRKIKERVMVRPEVVTFQEVPAVYEQRKKTVVIEEKRTVLQQCRQAGSRYAQGTGVVAYCSKEIPAKEKQVSTEVLVKPAETVAKVQPAEYKTVSKWVVAEPAKIIEVILEPAVEKVGVEEVVKPAQVHQREVAAVTRTFAYRGYEGQPQVVMRRAVCDSDLDKPLVSRLQDKLLLLGYPVGEVDGMLGKKTLAALSDYQVDVGLAVGAVTYETLESLGIK